jgi:hypothetical protein
MKKEVSEHLSKAFFENKKKKKSGNRVLDIILTLCIAVVLVFLIIYYINKGVVPFKIQGHQLVLEKRDGPFILIFDFSNAATKAQSLNIDLADMDLRGYDTLKFAIRLVDAGAQEKSRIKVALVNKRKENSSIYLPPATNSWKKLSLKFSAFKNIEDWSNLTQLVFTLEEWNLSSNKGRFMVDDIEFSKIAS